MDRPDSSAQPLKGSPAPGEAAPEPAGSVKGQEPLSFKERNSSLPAAPPPPEPAAEAKPAKPAASKAVERPLTIGQVQRILEMRLGFTVSINTLERWCRQAKIYAVRLGPEWRIPRQTVEELIKTALNGERL